MSAPPQIPSVFGIEHRRTGTTVHLLVSGGLDLCTASLLRAAHVRVEPACEVLVLDLSAVTFLDSSGLHALIDICDGDAPRVRIILSRAAARIIDICGLRPRLPIVEG